MTTDPHRFAETQHNLTVMADHARYSARQIQHLIDTNAGVTRQHMLSLVSLFYTFASTLACFSREVAQQPSDIAAWIKATQGLSSEHVSARIALASATVMLAEVEAREAAEHLLARSASRDEPAAAPPAG